MDLGLPRTCSCLMPKSARQGQGQVSEIPRVAVKIYLGHPENILRPCQALPVFLIVLPSRRRKK